MVLALIRGAVLPMREEKKYRRNLGQELGEFGEGLR